MIEGRGFPVVFVVTGSTLGAEDALMVVVFLVARDTIRLERIFVDVAGMAALTFGRAVFAGQPVFRITIMVEYDLPPIVFRMAGRALLTEVGFVLVVFLMAAVAIGRCVTVFDLRLVAGFAVGFPRIGMGAGERKICAGMVKSRFVDRGDVLLSPFMVRVAGPAFALRRQPTVESLLVFEVLPDSLVAIPA